MAQPVTFPGDVHFMGNVTQSSGYVNSPAPGAFDNADIAAAADILASKLEHQHALHYAQVPGTAIVAETRDIHIVRGLTGSVLAMQAAITGALADDVSRSVTVQLHKSTGAGAFATILTTAITFTSTDALRTVESAVINTAGLVVGDILRVVVTVAGGSGNQAQGLQVTVTITEKAS